MMDSTALKRPECVVYTAGESLPSVESAGAFRLIHNGVATNQPIVPIKAASFTVLSSMLP